MIVNLTLSAMRLMGHFCVPAKKDSLGMVELTALVSFSFEI